MGSFLISNSPVNKDTIDCPYFIFHKTIPLNIKGILYPCKVEHNPPPTWDCLYLQLTL